MAKTLAVVSVPDFKSESSRYDTKYKHTAKWDPVEGDFVRDRTCCGQSESRGKHGTAHNHRCLKSQSPHGICNKL